MNKIVITGGGTAGHINPAIAIANQFKLQENSEILYIGTENGLEATLVKTTEFDFKTIQIAGFLRKLTLSNLKLPFLLVKSVNQAKKYLREFRPNLVIGTGGYVCAPVLIAAIFLKIPFYIHEQNATFGLTNRMLSKYANKVFYSFESKETCNKEKYIYTGNPLDNRIFINNNISLRKKYDIGIDEKVIIVTTGSRGARSVNYSMVDYINDYYNDDYNLIFVTGKRDYEEVLKRLKDISKYKKLKIMDYMNERWEYYPMADLAIIRAGAITIEEFKALNIPMVMVPYPYATNQHQLKNAEAIKAKGAGIILEDNDLNSKKLFETISDIIYNEKKIEEMKMAFDNMKKNVALTKIYQTIKDENNVD